MRVLVQRFSTNPAYAKAITWGKLITVTGGAQLFVQIVSFASGILIIRLLSTQEYALYTLANTMLGTMTILADSGIANGVMAESGKVWQDYQKLGVVLATGLKLRKKFGVISLVITLPILGYLLVDNGADWLTMILIMVAIIPAFFAALSDSLLEIVPKLHQEIKPLQKNQAEVSIGKLVFTSALLLFTPYTFIALFANSIPRIYGNYRLRRISERFANQDAQTDFVVQKNLIKGVKRTLPIVVYYCLSSQISIWLISFLGTTTSIAQIGALGRIAVLFNLISAMFSTLIIPRFARTDSSKKILLQRFLLIQVGILLIGLIILIILWALSKYILWVLGSSYNDLHFELLLVAGSNCLGLMIGVCSQLVLSRGWFLQPYYLIGFNFLAMIISIVFFNMSSLIGVLYFNLVTAILHYLLMFVYALIKINKVK